MPFKTILLQGEHYVLGVDVAISIGCNMQCKKVITKSIICINDDGSFYCKNGGIAIKLRDQDLKDFYHNTPENRKMLKQLIADGKA